LVEEALRSVEAKEMRALTPVELAYDKAKLDRFECRVGQAMSHLLQRLTTLETTRAEQAILAQHPCASHSHITTIDVHLERAASFEWISYHVPAYVYQPVHHDSATLQLVHGYTGSVSGRSAWSQSKLVALTALLGAGAGFFISSPLALAARLVLPGGGAALAALVILRLYRVLRRDKETADITSERKSNDTIPDSHTDVLLRELVREAQAQAAAGDSNNNNDQEDTAGADATNAETDKEQDAGRLIRLSDVDARLFKLPPGVPVSSATLKRAYHQQLRVWHPDVYRGNNPLAAQRFTQQLTDRYQQVVQR
jgi:hypothetical protein